MIDLKVYKNFCKISNNLLKKDLKTFTVSNNFLNIVKEHPFYLEPYYNLSYKNSILLLNKYIIFIFADLFLGILSKVKNFFIFPVKQKIKIKKKVLIISHFIREDFINKKNDFYFGNLEKEINKVGISSYKILINHSNKHSKFLNNKIEKKKNVEILEKYSNYLDEINIIYLQLYYFTKYIFLFFTEKNFRNKKFILRTAVEFLNLSTKKNYRFSLLLMKILKSYNPDTLIITHEGYSWEKVVFKTAKNFNRKIKCIGYQHTGLTRYQTLLNEKLGQGFDPDLIWVTGKKVKNLLKKKNTVIIGSNKANNYKIVKHRLNKLNCLVIPEGIMPECKKIFNFSLKCAKLLPNINFIWRLHPMLNFKKIVNDFPNFKKLPKNIILSKNNDIYKDMIKSNICMYRGSSTIFQAISCGIFPIYLSLNEKIDIDTSHGLKKWKIKLNSENQLKIFLNYKLNKVLNSKIRKKIAINYSRNYFEKFKYEKAIKLLSK